jgi:2-desacetyl-2-hydroxyethyl bacteriochlorophyllide A dehydrogenase
MMRALLFRGPGSIDTTTIPEPELRETTDAIVTLEGAGLCGSDLHPYLGREPARVDVVPGHEGVGRVAAVGSDVSSFRAGDRVIIPFTTSCGGCEPCSLGLSSRCVRGELFGWGDPENLDVPALNGMQAEQVRVPLADTTLVKIPQSMSVGTALLLSDNLPTGWYAALRAEVRPGVRVAIVGSGSVGICAAIAASHLGADPITIVEPVEQRRSVVTGLPGFETFHPDDGLLRQSGPFESIIDAAGTPASQSLAFELAAAGATISMIAVQTEQTFGFTPIDVYDRNLTIRSGRAPVRSLLSTVLPAVVDGSVLDPSDRIFTHRAVALEEAPSAYRSFADRSGGVVKVWFDPSR